MYTYCWPIPAIPKATLEFCGIKPVKVTRIGRIKYADARKREEIVRQIARKMDDIPAPRKTKAAIATS